MRSITILMLLVGSVSTKAQENLIYNGDFEDYYINPEGYYHSSGWNLPTLATSDYFHSLNPNPMFSVPESDFGTCVPYSGEAYFGGFFFDPSGGYFEYIQGETTTPLEKGKTYKLSLKIALASISDRTINEFGVYFSTTPVFIPTTGLLDFVPQSTFYNPDFYTVKDNWMHTETIFTAQGCEKHFIFGNFKGPSADTIFLGGPTSYSTYFFIDDVRLVEVEGTQQSELVLIPNIFSPNGDGINDLFRFNLSGCEIYTVSILNRWGELVYEAPAENFFWNGETANGTPCNEGVYFYRISGANISGFFELIR